MLYKTFLEQNLENIDFPLSWNNKNGQRNK